MPIIFIPVVVLMFNFFVHDVIDTVKQHNDKIEMKGKI
jgi:hypothetical protein